MAMRHHPHCSGTASRSPRSCRAEPPPYAHSGSRAVAASAPPRAAAVAAAAAAALALQGCLVPGTAAAAAAAAAAAPLHQQQHVAAVAQLRQQMRAPMLVVQLRSPCPQTARSAPSPLVDLAGFFGDDPSDPFTLYGTNYKEYEVKKLDGEKVVSRQRGFTVTTCVSGKAASEETPLFNGLSTGAKVAAGEDLLCKQAVGQDLKASCKASCGSACEAALAAYEARLQAEAGLVLEPKERARVLRNCRHSCSYECTKSGKAHDFVVPSRR